MGAQKRICEEFTSFENVLQLPQLFSVELLDVELHSSSARSFKHTQLESSLHAVVVVGCLHFKDLFCLILI